MSIPLLLINIPPYWLIDITEKRKEKRKSIVNTKDTIAMELLSNNLASPEWIRDNIFEDNLEKYS